MAGYQCVHSFWHCRNDSIFHHIYLSDALYQMESQPHLGIPDPFPSRYFVDVSLHATKIVLVCPPDSHSYHAISYFNVFPSTDLPLAGGAVVFDFDHPDRNVGKIF